MPPFSSGYLPDGLLSDNGWLLVLLDLIFTLMHLLKARGIFCYFGLDIYFHYVEQANTTVSCGVLEPKRVKGLLSSSSQDSWASHGGLGAQFPVALPPL